MNTDRFKTNRVFCFKADSQANKQITSVFITTGAVPVTPAEYILQTVMAFVDE